MKFHIQIPEIQDTQMKEGYVSDLINIVMGLN
jgi:hypothetical protein